MTENEAIKRVREFGLHHAIKDLPHSGLTVQAFEMAISALEEIQQYRALGTVEELRKFVANGKIYEQAAWERDIAIEQLKEIGCSLGEKMDEIKKASGKQIPKKPKIKSQCPPNAFGGWYIWLCPSCGNQLGVTNRPNKFKFCEKCGQRIDWSEEE